MTKVHDQPGGIAALLGVGAALVVVACCALLPLLLAGGAIAGIGGVLRSPWAIGIGIALVVLTLVARSGRRRGGAGGHEGRPPARSRERFEPSDELDS